MEQVMTALSDPRRRQIVELLTERPRQVGELVQALPIAQSGVSRHLRILKEAGLVACRSEGQRRIYSLQPRPFEELSDWLDRVRLAWEGRLDNLEQVLARSQASSLPLNEEDP